MKTAEPLEEKVSLRRKGKAVARTRTTPFSAPKAKLALRVSADAKRGRAKLSVKLTDGAGDSITDKRTVRLPDA